MMHRGSQARVVSKDDARWIGKSKVQFCMLKTQKQNLPTARSVESKSKPGEAVSATSVFGRIGPHMIIYWIRHTSCQIFTVLWIELERPRFLSGIVLYCWSCSQCQLSLCISVCALFAEPVVGKTWAKRLEENVTSCRNYRLIYSLLTGVAAITQPLSWLTQQPKQQP